MALGLRLSAPNFTRSTELSTLSSAAKSVADTLQANLAVNFAAALT